MTALGPGESARIVLGALEAGRRAITAVVTRGPSELIASRCVFSEGETLGSLGSESLTREARATADSLFEDTRSSGAREVVVSFEDGSATVYFELHAPRPDLVIVGAGHLAQPLAQIGALLGFRVVVLDDRPEFASHARFPDAEEVRVIDFRDPFQSTPLRPSTHVVLVTRGHRFDYECLVHILNMEVRPGYVGMIGSRRRVRATHEQLVSEGYSLDLIRTIRAPVGLDLGGQTPAEIAVSVAEEIIQLRSGGEGMPLSEKERIVDRFFAEPGTEAAHEPPQAAQEEEES